MDQAIFEKELTMCRELNHRNGGRCNWGECKTCGVIPFLYKLHKGVFLETEEEIQRVKHEVLGTAHG